MPVELLQKLAQLIANIDAGVVTASCNNTWDKAFCGNVEFKTTNGWTVVVFNDCGEWDYIDSAISPDGETLDFDDIYPVNGPCHVPEPSNLDNWGLKKGEFGVGDI